MLILCIYFAQLNSNTLSQMFIQLFIHCSQQYIFFIQTAVALYVFSTQKTLRTPFLFRATLRVHQTSGTSCLQFLEIQESRTNTSTRSNQRILNKGSTQTLHRTIVSRWRYRDSASALFYEKRYWQRAGYLIYHRSKKNIKDAFKLHILDERVFKKIRSIIL